MTPAAPPFTVVAMPALTGPLWHLIVQPRAPFRCDVCGAPIADDAWDTFTTLRAMYYDTPPSGYTPCNRGVDPFAVRYSNTVSNDSSDPS